MAPGGANTAVFAKGRSTAAVGQEAAGAAPEPDEGDVDDPNQPQPARAATPASTAIVTGDLLVTRLCTGTPLR